MIQTFGNLFLILTLLLTITILIFTFDFFKLDKSTNLKILRLMSLQTTFSIMSFVTLVLAFLISDFSIKTVVFNSHSDKPLLYKISGVWGNHEGSLLLWLNIMVVVSLLFFYFDKFLSNQLKFKTILFHNFLILGFLLFILVFSNPFEGVLNVPKEGLGLNPILQDPALAIHPPLLYLGFVGSSIYFSAALAALTSSTDIKLFAKAIKFWVFISWSFLSLGIIVGSIWAYYELGWGGFWFWDPVENASLLPWLAITALIHSLLILEKKGKTYDWVIILCLMTFILSITGTFLVRSGILNSVHTFASDPSRGLYILCYLIIMITTSIYFFLKRKKNISDEINIKSKDGLIVTNNWFMMFYLVTVLLGTIYPIITDVVFDQKISVGPPYYNTVIGPIIVPFLILMAIAPTFNLLNFFSKKIIKILFVFLLSVIVNIVIVKFYGKVSLLSMFLIVSSFFLIIYSFQDLMKKIFDKSNISSSRIMSHLGFGLLIFFIVMNHNFSIEGNFNTKLGESNFVENYKIKLDKLQLIKKKNYESLVGEFTVNDTKKNTVNTLFPEIRIYKNPETITYEASITTKMSNDIYLTMSNINRSEMYNVKFQKKQFMIWIWLSALLIAFSGFFKVRKKDEI